MEEIIDRAFAKYGMQQKRTEIKQLMEFVKNKGCKNMIEIGTATLGTTYAIGNCLKQGSILITIDLKQHFTTEQFVEVWTELGQKGVDLKHCIADSHKEKTNWIVSNVLKEEKADLLWIDGDHSYKGVKQDYEMYKEFVNDGGIIAFHDILGSEYHHKAGCEVDILWKEIRGEKWEICYTEEKSEPNINPIFYDKIWGGIGILGNEKTEYKLYQVCYSPRTEYLACIKQAIKYNNKGKLTELFENEVIINLLPEIIKGEHLTMYGVISPLFTQKTRFNSVTLDRKIQALNNQYDVIFMPPPNLIGTNVVERDKQAINVLYNLRKLIDATDVLPFKFIDYGWTPCEWTCSYCNYWLTKKKVYIDYVEKIMKPCINVMKTGKIKSYIDTHILTHNGKEVKMYPFILETLMGFYVNSSKITHTTIKADG